MTLGLTGSATEQLDAAIKPANAAHALIARDEPIDVGMEIRGGEDQRVGQPERSTTSAQLRRAFGDHHIDRNDFRNQISKEAARLVLAVVANHPARQHLSNCDDGRDQALGGGGSTDPGNGAIMEGIAPVQEGDCDPRVERYRHSSRSCSIVLRRLPPESMQPE